MEETMAESGARQKGKVSCQGAHLDTGAESCLTERGRSPSAAASPTRDAFKLSRPTPCSSALRWQCPDAPVVRRMTSRLPFHHHTGETPAVFEFGIDRKSTRLNSSHGYISYAVFCL